MQNTYRHNSDVQRVRSLIRLHTHSRTVISQLYHFERQLFSNWRVSTTQSKLKWSSPKTSIQLICYACTRRKTCMQNYHECLDSVLYNLLMQMWWRTTIRQSWKLSRVFKFQLSALIAPYFVCNQFIIELKTAIQQCDWMLRRCMHTAQQF